MGKITKKPKVFNGKKPRKLLRKEKRQEKKKRKLDYYVNRNKPGKFVLAPNKNQTDNKESSHGKLENKNQKNPQTKKKNVKFIDQQTKDVLEDKRKKEKLEKEMRKQRKRQMEEAAIEEDKIIKRLEKDLKLNKRKSKSIPQSFTSDGLDYILEMCDPEKIKNIASSENIMDGNDDFEEDFAIVTGKKAKITTETQKPKKKKDSELLDDEFFATNDDLEIEDSDVSNDDNDSDEEMEDEDDEFGDENNMDDEESDDEMELEDENDDFNEEEDIKYNNKNENLSVSDEENNFDVEELKKDNNDHTDNEISDDDNVSNSSKDNGTWEDIYGRKRKKDGTVIEKPIEKYIPPALRNQDSKRSEKLTRLKRQIKGLINRLAENNMHSISSQMEDLYMNNSRNDMNETLMQIMFESLISPAITPERLLLEHITLIAILHANVGTEVGAHFLLNIIRKFDNLIKLNQEVENKELDNAVHIIAQLYNFKIYPAQLLYQIIERLAANFEEKHVECILLILKSVGFSLRKDDPIALKQIIIDLQKKATTVSSEDARVKYMLDVLLAIKNNNVMKIPNYDTTYSEHLKKLLKGFIRKGNYITKLNITLDDLLKADERGKWWVVGSAWSGMDEKTSNENETKISTPVYSQKLLELARKQRMNTDTRRNIFCIIMSAEDYLDAFEKLLRLGLKNQQEREIIHVILHCCLQEKNYNPYYAVLTNKFCQYDRKYQMTIRCSIWDKLKALDNCSTSQLSNLAKLLAYLFIELSLPISTLKVIEFADLDKITLRFMRQVLLQILLHENEETCLEVFSKVAKSPKLKTFRDSLRLFIHHFLLKNLKDGVIDEDKKELLQNRVQTVEKVLISGEARMQMF